MLKDVQDRTISEKERFHHYGLKLTATTTIGVKAERGCDLFFCVDSLNVVLMT
jgi:hypothetical protein